MSITFEAEMGSDQVIRPPAGVVLPEGKLWVTVQKVVATESDPVSKSKDWLLKLAREAERLNSNLPTDLATHHDHYAHGKPLE
ncbi:MAG: hypothetical protein QM703_03665 [Gemmatales bacterium]